MALVVSTLVTELRKIFDQQYSGFEGFPPTVNDAASRWAQAINTYAGTNIVPSSTSAVNAKNSFETILRTLLSNSNGTSIIQNAFNTYATVLASGMTGYVSVPPPSPIDFQAVFSIGFNGGSSSAVASSMANVIHTWFKTGIATPIGGGPTINWS